MDPNRKPGEPRKSFEKPGLQFTVILATPDGAHHVKYVAAADARAAVDDAIEPFETVSVVAVFAGHHENLDPM